MQKNYFCVAVLAMIYDKSMILGCSYRNSGWHFECSSVSTLLETILKGLQFVVIMLAFMYKQGDDN